MNETPPRLQLFRIGNTSYGLEIGSIQDVVDDPPLYSVPQTGPFLLGVINLHGQVLPVIDLPGLLGVDVPPRDQRLVVLTPELHSLALAVSGLGRIATFAPGELRQPTAAERVNAIAGVVALAGSQEAVNLLDASAVVERLTTIYAA